MPITETTSQAEIRRWTDILARDQTNGIDRLRLYVASMIGSRKPGQSAEEQIASRDLTEFVAWARNLQ